MTSPSGSTPTISHTDSYASVITDHELEDEYQVDISYSELPSTEEYGPVESRGTDIELSHPVDTVEELRYTSHLQAQLRQANIDSLQPSLSKERGRAASDEVEFDRAVLRGAEVALRSQGLRIDELPGSNEQGLAVLLLDARGESYPGLAKHLDAVNGELTNLGISSSQNQSTYWRVNQEMRETGVREAVGNAGAQLAYAAYRIGMPIPSSAQEAHNLPVAADLDEHTIDPDVKDQALRNWVNELLDLYLEEFDLGRRDNKSVEMREFFGLLASSALEHRGLKVAADNARIIYGPENIPSPTLLPKHLQKEEIDLGTVSRLFSRSTIHFFQEVGKRGFFDETVAIGFDPTRFDTIDDSPHTIGHPDSWGPPNQAFRFDVLGGLQNASRFAIGGLFVDSKAEDDDVLHNLLRVAKRSFGASRVFMDREMNGADFIDACRSVFGAQWVIRAKNGEPFEAHFEEAPEGEVYFKRGLTYSNLKRPFNFLAFPASEDKSYSHRGYITDLDLDDVTPKDLDEAYLQRFGIETTIRQSKYDTLPYTQSTDPVVRSFFYNTGLVFFNFHTLINRAPSPEYCLRLHVTAPNVLAAIRDVVFGPQPTSR